jgi:molybdate transport system substrate-binding protein
MVRASFVLVFILCTGTLAGLPGAVPPARADEPLRLAVAANFRGAAEALAARFTEIHGTEVVISSAATGVLAAQWRRGAPFDLLLAADRERPAALAAEGLSQGPSDCYAVGSLVLLGGGSLEPALADATLSIAIANPRSAPYGAAAIAVLERPGFAGPGARRVVMGGNVQQAYQFFASGAADLALVARSLSPREGLPIPVAWHAPIEQHAIINAGSPRGDLARALLALLQEPAGLRLLAQFGYQPCP